MGIANLKMVKRENGVELLVSDDTIKYNSKITSPWRRIQAKAPETKKLQRLDLKLLLHGGTRELKIESPILKY